MALQAHTALPLALATPMSAVEDFYASSAFASFRKTQEAKGKAQTAMFGRLDVIAKQIGNLIKVMARR